jgi:hypothetical protein
MFRDFLKPLLLLAVLLPLGCDKATSSIQDLQPKAQGMDSTTLLQGGWLRIDSAASQVQSMRLEAKGVGRIADWTSGAILSQSRFAWKLEAGLLVRTVDSGAGRLASTVWSLKGDTLRIGPGGGLKWVRSIDPESKAKAASVKIATPPEVDTGKGVPSDTADASMVLADSAGMSGIWLFIDTSAQRKVTMVLDLRSAVAFGYFQLSEESVLHRDTIGPWSVDREGRVALGETGEPTKLLLRRDTVFLAEDSTPVMTALASLPDLPIFGETGVVDPPSDTLPSCLPAGRDVRLLGEWVPPGAGMALTLEFQANGMAVVGMPDDTTAGTILSWGTKGNQLTLSLSDAEGCSPAGTFQVVGDTLRILSEDGEETWVRPTSIVVPDPDTTSDTGTVVDTIRLVCPGMGIQAGLVGSWSATKSEIGTSILDFGADGVIRLTFVPAVGSLDEPMQDSAIWMANQQQIIVVGADASEMTCLDGTPYTLEGGLLTIEGTEYRRLEVP